MTKITEKRFSMQNLNTAHWVSQGWASELVRVQMTTHDDAFRQNEKLQQVGCNLLRKSAKRKPISSLAWTLRHTEWICHENEFFKSEYSWRYKNIANLAQNIIIKI